ncbi:class I SAM-dependent methyltransferase [Peribacillus saganii]|uniref:Class I SAM-dependent methyltransferase n=1 Tax=Peribacillus saganii TaxID=2303992 RepID=A0A372LNM6_9BACI|nr:class I SAM-dependent methyltransferase [Peribacillus saganii]RFU68639.1 class I SAM-dependent methyltransferase [Peribacillus saganii]
MSEHYYSKNPETESNPIYWNFDLKGRNFRFKSDSGVFSKKEVDFGSRLLIEAFNLDQDIPGDILDVGCGYGPIGLSVASAHPARIVHMVDVNNRAIELSKENARANAISNVEIYESDLFSAVARKEFAAILTNPPIRAGKTVVHEIFEKSFEYLTTGGTLWVVIQKKQGAPSAMEKIEQLFGNVEVAEKKKGYYILAAKKV